MPFLRPNHPRYPGRVLSYDELSTKDITAYFPRAFGKDIEIYTSFVQDDVLSEGEPLWVWYCLENPADRLWPTTYSWRRAQPSGLHWTLRLLYFVDETGNSAPFAVHLATDLIYTVFTPYPHTWPHWVGSLQSLYGSGYKERQLDEWFRTRRQLSPPNRLAIRYVVLPGSGQEVQLRSTALREFASLRVTSDAEMFLRMLTDKLHGMVRGYMDRT